MKRIIALVIVALAWAHPAQACMDTEPEIKPFEKAEEHQAEGHTQQEIYMAARNWVAETFNNAKAVTMDDNQAAGTIHIKGNAIIKDAATGLFGETIGEPERMNFRLRIDTKDGRYRTTWNYEGSTAKTFFGAVCKDINDNIRKEITDITSSLHKAVVNSKKSDQW